MRFDIDNYKGKYVMHCKTEEEAREFCDYIRHCDVHYDAHAAFRFYRDKTCFNFNANTHAPKGYYEENGYTILEWSDFTTEFTKADLKDGMVVELANGNKYLVLGEVMLNNTGSFKIERFDDNLELKGYDPKVWAINKAYSIKYACWLQGIFDDDNLTLIWERKEEPKPVEMTLEEVCKALGKEIKIVKG